MMTHHFSIYVQAFADHFHCKQQSIDSQEEDKDQIKLPVSKMKFFGAKALPILVVFVVVMTSLVVVQGQVHGCGSTFFSALVQLIPCRAAVAPFSPIPPSEACCNAIRALGQPCLCVLVNGPPISGVDRNMALQLPDKCTANFEPCESQK